MRKEWLYWGNSKSSKRGRFRKEENETSPPSGCMCAVFQLFDLNHFQFALNHQPSFQPHHTFLQEEESIVLKGVEAPRNSLELVERPSMEASSISSTKRKDADLNIPVNIQIKTRCDNRSPRESTSECSGSPSTKTPSLVARLMGLDLLPEGGSPSSSSSRQSISNSLVKSRLHNLAQNRNEDRARHLLEIKSSKNSGNGTRSLPETPRVSSSSSRRSDVDQRLSLQLNKENIGEEFDLSAYIAKKVARRREARQENENKSPSSSHYARQIVKQVKENVSRKVGLIDITNTIKNKDLLAKHEHENVVLLKPKKSSDLYNRPHVTRASDEISIPSCSNSKNKQVKSLPNDRKNQTSHSPKYSSVAHKILPNVHFPQQQNNHEQNPSIQTREKVANSDRYNSRLKKPPQASNAILNKREDPFVRSPSKSKMCKKISLSNELLNNNVPTLLQVKKIHKKQDRQLPSCSSQSYNQREKQILLVVPEDKCNGAITSVNEAEYQYIQRILKRTGLDKSTSMSLAKWYTPNHPLDPSIFHHIELFHHTYSTIFTSKSSKLNQRCNRKLIFQLIDELLAEILKPYFDFNQRCQLNGSQLIDTLCSRIEAFPLANCLVLEDIDALIDKDLRERKRINAFEEEREIIVIEIERDIVESLVHEMAMEVFGTA